MKFGYIYKITYLDNRSHLFNHYYFGMRVLKKSENIYDCNDKTYYHGSSSRANKEYWSFYSKHKKEIICWCDSIEELRQKEMEIIDLHINEELCINVQRGGSGNRFIGKTPDEIGDIKQRISYSLKQTYKEHPELLINMSNIRKGKPSGMKGKHHSEESKKKQSESRKHYIENGGTPWNKGKGKPKIKEESNGQRCSNFKGHHHTKESKLKLSIAHLGKQLSDEHKKKIGNALIGRKNGPLSEEHKKNLSLAHKGKPTWNKGQKGLVKHINNGIESKMVEINKLEEYLNNGWKLGRIYNRKK